MTQNERPGSDAADVLVVGSGIAGLTAALNASRTAHVLLVTKESLLDGATQRAQGGIAGAVGPGDTPALHARDTRTAGAGLCEAEAVQVLCEEGPAAIAELIAHGVAFDPALGDPGPAGFPYALGLEGAHDRPRILHAGGDATGRAIQHALVDAVRRAAGGSRGTGSLRVREGAALVDLAVEAGSVVGAEMLTADGSRLQLRAGATVLATGGAGQLFAHTTNPDVATGDGTAAAWRAGADLADLEFFQFHPTALAGPDAFLISEAVRGDGAVLLDGQGRRFLERVDPRAELAPRDVVARVIAQVMQAQGGRPVLLDATALGPEHLRRRFPTIDAAVRARGIDWSRRPVPVTPAAHYWMGGIRTALDGATTLPGLFAAGECARTGVHGANRLASNSLLEGAVFGARAGRAAATDSWSSAGTGTSTGAGAPGPFRRGVPAERPSPSRTQRPGGAEHSGLPWTRAELQHLMWDGAGLLRTGEQLAETAQTLTSWASPPAETLTSIAVLEDRNLLDLARLLVPHALARLGSVGAHHRLDAVGADDRPPLTVPAQEDHAC